MISFLNIRTVARFEIKTLLRGWFFRIFSALTIIILAFFNLMVITDVGPTPPWMFRAIPASIPYFNLMLFNLVQAVIVVFLASDFLKRDKKLDTTDVIYIRSMSNGDYVLGKTIGILTVFLLLNIAVMLVALTFNIIQTDTPIVWSAYLLYPLLISLPTLLFIIGLSFLAMVIFRNQAITFLVLLGYIAITLFFVSGQYNFILDYMVFKLPMMYSDFIGFGNIKELLLQRGIYFCLGGGFIFLTILFIKRLPQSTGMTRLASLLSACLLVLAAFFTGTYLMQYTATEQTRAAMTELNTQNRHSKILHIDNYDISLQHHGTQIEVQTVLQVTNQLSSPVDHFLFSLNPGLKITEIKSDGQSMEFTRNLHLVDAVLSKELAPGQAKEISISYRGHIDDQLSYLDVEDETLNQAYNIAFMKVDKRYGFIEKNYLLLTREVLWYPIAGPTYSPENPTFANRQFSKYRLTVKTAPGFVPISQGGRQQNADSTVTFTEALPLPQVSLIIGKYAQKTMTVDSIDYHLYFLPGHDYFTPYVNELSDTLAAMVRGIKQDYESDLNLDYYYHKFNIVEVPIQFCAYNRRWANYQEVVQPEMVFLPEKCANLSAADFKSIYVRETKRIEKSNEAITAKETQARILNRFLTGTFTNGFSGMHFNGMRSGNRTDFARALTAPSAYQAFPNFYSFIYHLSSGKWAVINLALEAYLTAEGTEMMSVIRRRVGGLSGDELANQALLHKSFDQLLHEEHDKAEMDEIIKAKGTYLFSYLEHRVGIEQFDNFLSSILKTHKFSSLTIEEFADSLQHKYGLALAPVLDKWLQQDHLPGYTLSNEQAVEIREGENTRYQVSFTIRNQEDVPGLITVSFRTAGGFGGFRGGGPPSLDLAKIIEVPAHTAVDAGIVLDAEPRMMVINTLISRNIPSSLSHFFSKISLNEKLKPFDGIRIKPAPPADSLSNEIVADNEDESFELIQPNHQSKIRQWLDLKNDENTQKYVGIRYNKPPLKWTATTQPEFYGKYVLSAYVKASGTGEQKAVWHGQINTSGMYKIYYFVGKLPDRGRGRPGRPPRDNGPGGNQGKNNQNKGNYHFTIYHDDGEAEIQLDIGKAAEGWNLLGSFYLSAGPAKVTLTDKSDAKMIIADAVKWQKDE